MHNDDPLNEEHARRGSTALPDSQPLAAYQDQQNSPPDKQFGIEREDMDVSANSMPDEGGSIFPPIEHKGRSPTISPERKSAGAGVGAGTGSSKKNRRRNTEMDNQIKSRTEGRGGNIQLMALNRPAPPGKIENSLNRPSIGGSEQNRSVSMIEQSQPDITEADEDEEDAVDERLEGAKLDVIRAKHERYQLDTNQFSTAKDFMDKVMFSVPLNKLYKVIGSCNYNEDAEFCPVLVEIIDPVVLRNNDNLKFLLQVWNTQGDMVFEKPLRQPVSNWNISRDKFIFQEHTYSNEIYIVKLYKDKQAVVLKFILPQHAVANRINTLYMNDRFVIPDEQDYVEDENDERNHPDIVDMSEHGSQAVLDALEDFKAGGAEAKDDRTPQDDVAEMRNQGAYHILEIEKKEKGVDREQAKHAPSTFASATIPGRFRANIIKRAPDRMIDHLNDHVLLAYRNSIIYLDVSAYGIDDEQITVPDQLKASGQYDAHFITINVAMDQLLFFELHPRYKIVCIQEIGQEMSAFVLEDIVTRQIRFLRAYFAGTEARRRLKLVQLGVLVNSTSLTPSKLLKYRAVAKTDPETNKCYQVGIVLRENGRFEVYSDFMLVNEYIDPEYQCVDVKTDFHQFYLKFVKNSHTVTGAADLTQDRFEIRKIEHFWRNRISFNTSKILKSNQKWQYVTHGRIAQYFKLYTQILNFSMYMCVSHRNMISIYDMKEGSNAGQWSDTIEFGEGNIVRKMFIKKRSLEERNKEIRKKQRQGRKQFGKASNMLSIYKKYNLVSIVGTHSVYFTELTSRGEFKRAEKAQQISPGRILNFKDDVLYNCGVLVLTDDGVASPSYRAIQGCTLYTFPLDATASSGLCLRVLKMNTFYTLLDSALEKEDIAKCLTYDSTFNIMQANKAVFMKAKKLQDGDAEEKDEVAEAFDKNEFCKVVVVSSALNDKCLMFPLAKEKVEKVVKRMKLIKEEGHIKEVKYPKGENEGTPFHQFYITSEEFGENQDCFAQVSEKEIRIYDRGMSPYLRMRGLNIRNCVDVHQSYLYCISDNITHEIDIEGQKEQCLSTSGFYVYDLERLFEGKVEKYKLATAIGGLSNLIDISKFSQRFSFIQNFDNIAVIPFPHLNLINCVGMGQKNEYMIWREKNGFFTALDRKSNLFTWSLTSGKLLYSETQVQDASEDQIEDYEVYQADEKDRTYTRNFYNFEDYSISLLRSEQVIDEELASKHLKMGSEEVMEKLEKQERKNQAGLVNLDHNVAQLEKKLFRPSANEMKVQILNSQQKAELYHFKVMELKTHEDTKDQIDGGGSQCRLRFHFIFDIIKRRYKEHLKDFDWDVNSAPMQRLYLSRDTTKMMEVINNFIATVYKRVDVDSNPIDPDAQDENKQVVKHEDYGQQVKWKIDFRIKRFPRSLAIHTSVPYLFSPNFTYQLDFNYRAKQFCIKVTKTQYVYMYLPGDLLSTSFGSENEGQKAIQIICSRIKWEDEKRLRIVNESNLDCLFEMKNNDPEDKHMKDRYLKLLSVVKIDNQHENMVRIDSPHLLMERVTLEARDILERLIRMSQNYKTKLFHALATQDQSFNILEQINKIDYSQDWNNQYSNFDVEMCFTWLDWRIADLVVTKEDFDLERVDKEQKIQLCFNIFPRGRGILHALALASGGEDKEQTGDQVQASHAAKDLFEITRETHKLGITGIEECEFEIPILPDIYGTTPLDLCLFDKKESLQTDSTIFKADLQALKELSDSRNTVLAEYIFEGISHYGFMHASYIITEALIEATKINLQHVGEYMESRLENIVEYSFKNKKTQKAILKKQQRHSDRMGSYGILHTPVWAPESEIKDQLFDNQGALQPMSLTYLDIPHIHRPTKLGAKFIEALGHCSDAKINENGLDIFRNKSVQIIVDNHWYYWQLYNKICVGLPMFIQLLVFWYWSNIVLVNLKTDTDLFEPQDLVCRIILNITAFYLLAIEVTTVAKQNYKYIQSMTRLFNLITPVLIMHNLWVKETQTTSFWTVQTYAAIAIWIRFLQYLSTTENFSWMIRLINLSFFDMKWFLVVLFIGVLGFADAFKSIEMIMIITGKIEATEVAEDAGLYEKYFKSYILALQKSFLTALGEFDDSVTDGSMREGDWIVFLLCAIFNIILLLNLLIAIISETYTNVSATKIESNYREKVQEMINLQDSVFGLKLLNTDVCELIFVAKVLETNEEEKVDVHDKIDQLEEQLDRIKNDIIVTNGEKIEQIAKKILKGLDDDEDGDGGAAVNRSRFQNDSMTSKRMTSIEAKRSGSDGRAVSQIGKKQSTQVHNRKSNPPNLPSGSPGVKQYKSQLEAVKDVAPDKEQ